MYGAWPALAVLLPLLLSRRTAPLSEGAPYRWAAYCACATLVAAAGFVFEAAARRTFGGLSAFLPASFLLLAVGVVGSSFAILVAFTAGNIAYFRRRWRFLR